MSLALISCLAWAQEEAPEGWGDVAPAKLFDTRIYGFLDTLVQGEAKTPAYGPGGETVWHTNPVEVDIPNLHVMVQGKINGKYTIFLNLASPSSASVIDDEPIVVRNAWLELPLWGERLQLRAGKTYRRFGLYNEILDAVPTFIGIEPPEMFDKDHLMVTRATNLMLHGSVPLGSTQLMYAVTSGNDERTGWTIPLGADLRADLAGKLLVGSSFYTSGGPAVPGRAVGEGSPRGGVASWMAEDRYVVYGGFAQLTAGALLLQTEYWQADHDAERDPASVALLADAGLNPTQTERFSGEPDVQYTVRTAYARAGYDLPVGKRGSVTPYLQGDWFSNPEIIDDKDFGGDAEAGRSDDGQFLKYTAGLVIRPLPQIALKVDGSAHHFRFNGEMVAFPEARVSLSYLWDLGL